MKEEEKKLKVCPRFCVYVKSTFCVVFFVHELAMRTSNVKIDAIGLEVKSIHSEGVFVRVYFFAWTPCCCRLVRTERPDLLPILRGPSLRRGLAKNPCGRPP